MQVSGCSGGCQADEQGRPKQTPGANAGSADGDDFTVAPHARQPNHDARENGDGQREN